MRADLRVAIERLFDGKAVRAVEFRQQHGYEKTDLTALWTSGRNAYGVSAISYEELDVGEATPMQCQNNGLGLLVKHDARYAAILSRELDYQGGYTIFLEISGPQGEQTTAITRALFDAVEAHIRAVQSYRGKVLSLEQSPHVGGSSIGITVHKMQPVYKEDIILPEKTLGLAQKQLQSFSRKRAY